MLKSLGLVCALLLSVLTSTAQASPTGLKVGIYSGTGAESDKTLALYRAVASLGHTPLALQKTDLTQGRLTAANFDVFIIPAGEDGKRCCAGHFTDDGDAMGGIPAQNAIRNFLNSGRGVVALEAGAFFASKNGTTLDIYDANYNNVTNQIGKRTLTIVDPAFGSGTLEAWNSYGGGYFSIAPGAVVVARNASNQPVIVSDTYGSGRVILASHVLELRGDSELDWTSWDNWAMGTHTNSQGNWELLGRMIGWAHNGDSSLPTVTSSNPPGLRFAMINTHTTNGGAWPGLLPALARSIEASGHIPVAMRFSDVAANRLDTSFDVVVFPGGYAYGYKVGLAGHETKIRNFISAGGSYLGICAGGFYAPGIINWEGKSYTYPLNIYTGTAIGAINAITPWPNYTLTPITVSDPLLAPVPFTMQNTYYGGGYFTLVAGATSVGVYDAVSQPDFIRFSYGSGRVFLTGTHPESRAGSDEDWLYWDGYDFTGATLTNPDNPWTFLSTVYNWLIL